MKQDAAAFDFWERTIYGKGDHMNRYPYDCVVSFIYRHYPRNKEREDIHILEVGSGAGNNLWFAAREGFSVSGIDGSASAIQFAVNRFREDNLKGEFVVGDFSNLPYPDNKFDLVIDRGSITCNSMTNAKQIIEEIHRVLVKGGIFFFNPYSSKHTSANGGTRNEDGTVSDIKQGSLIGIEHIYFYNREEISELLPSSAWDIKSITHIEMIEEYGSSSLQCDYRVIAQKK